MSRTKKTRKSGVGSNGAPKETNKTIAPVPDKRIRKHKGKQAGNRQKEAQIINEQSTEDMNKDPRLGSKKLIDLGQPKKEVTTSVPVKTQQGIQTRNQPKAQSKKTNKPQQPSVAPIRTIEPVIDQTDLLNDELEAIEQDERILLILSKQEDDIQLSEDDINYFNDKMERHEDICQILGISDDEDDEPVNQQTSSEDDLWNKFDNSDLSKFE